jgi:hypothetical protein
MSKKDRLQGLELIRQGLKKESKILRKKQRSCVEMIEYISIKHEAWIRSRTNYRKPEPLSQKKQNRIRVLEKRIIAFQKKIDEKEARISDIEWAIKCLRVVKI